MRARPTVYKGIQMRSRLESRMASMLDAAGITWEYEPRAYRGKRFGEYLPDFQVGERTWVEVKGPNDDAAWEQIRHALQVLWECNRRGWLWVVFGDGRTRIWEIGDLAFVSGFMYLCRSCHRPTISDFGPLECPCGGSLQPASNWLSFPSLVQ